MPLEISQQVELQILKKISIDAVLQGVDGKSMSKCWGGVMSQLGNVAENHRQLATVLGIVIFKQYLEYLWS